MEKLKPLLPLASFTIAFCAVFSALGLMFGILLNPVKNDLREFKTEVREEIREVKAEVREFKAEVREFKAEVNTKLDKLLAEKK